MPNPHDFPAAGGRLESGGSSPGCWDALWEIKSCMNEIEAYFINGTIDIGPPCCQAITTITRHCWPAVLAGVGVTPEESDILRGYCDAESAAADVVVSFQPLPSPAVVLN
ncbi:unnamed protein product [Cuscuta campestris]|uniref:Prolamin-like domain-containing protein n=1 Tax=Cuscuta campestris TaxID=132261 RepID=A0A484N5G0_9ASTE|nr:unnamed protein product [Cuscuta campestris]